MRDTRKQLGAPSIHIQGLQLWVFRREFSDEDWLVTTIHCGMESSDIWIYNQATMLVSDLKQLAIGLSSLIELTKQEAIFSFTEPFLQLEFKINKLPLNDRHDIEMIVYITPNVLTQSHTFVFHPSLKELQTFKTDAEKVLDMYAWNGRHPNVNHS